MQTPIVPARRSRADQVQDALERRILAGELAPGTQLVEEEVALSLEVSRGPVREAFRALEQKGLVTTVSNRGVFVREVTLREADDIYVVRAGLDLLIGRLVAERLTAPRLAELRGLLSDMDLAARVMDVDAYYPLNVEFHDLLARLTGNATLLASYRALVNCLHLYRRTTLARGDSSFPISVREHHDIVDALAAGNGELAGSLLYTHAMQSRERLHGVLDSR
jgi:DNA-binding GntR family transcriptional regulator